MGSLFSFLGGDAAIRPVRLPQDEFPHPHAVEWWHFMFRVEAARDAETSFGPRTYVLSVLRHHRLLAGLLLESDEAGREHRVFRAYAAMLPPWYTTPGEDFRFAFRSLAPIAGWQVNGAQGGYNLAVDLPGVELELGLSAQKPAVRLGDDGVVDYGGGIELAYYCWTDLEVHGWIDLAGQRVPATGRGWMEHQWGSVDAWSYRWKYISGQLDGNRELLAFAFWDGQSDQASLTRTWCALVSPDGTLRQFRDDEVQLDHEGNWRGYPLRTRIRVPSADVDIRVEPTFEEQRVPGVSFSSKLKPFWEGVSRLSGRWGEDDVKGWAISELAGWE